VPSVNEAAQADDERPLLLDKHGSATWSEGGLSDGLIEQRQRDTSSGMVSLAETAESVTQKTPLSRR